uniref:Uncharacterized protein n=1 Tax=Arundo donax TaxID=35708 RepID=A0A0A9V159_ARUDO
MWYFKSILNWWGSWRTS